MYNRTTPTMSNDVVMNRLPFWSHIVALILYILLFLMAVLGNSMALYILRTKQELRTLTHAFLTNLIVADLLLALLTPFEALSIFLSSYAFDDAGCKLQRTFLYFFYAASILTLSAISLERFVAICYPMKYDTFKERKTKILIFIWLASFAIVSPHIYLSEERTTADGEIVCFQFYTTERGRVGFFWGYSLPIFFLLYLLPLTLVTVTYFQASKTLAKMEERLTKNSQCDLTATVSMRKEVLRMLFVVIVFFVVQWTPFEIVELLSIAPGRSDFNPIGPLRVAVHMVAFSNAVLNPVLFGFMSRPFREGFKEAFQYFFICKCCPRCCFGIGNFKVISLSSNSKKTNGIAASSVTKLSELNNTSQFDIDWERSLHRLDNPISIVENELQADVSSQDVDQNCVVDQKL